MTRLGVGVHMSAVVSRSGAMSVSPAVPGGNCYNVLAIDPGGTTGWCYISGCRLFGGGVGFVENDLDIVAGQIGPVASAHTTHVPDENSMVAWLLKLHAKLVARDGYINVLAEDFILRIFDGSRSVLSPVRLTAALSFGLFGRGVSLDCSQSASTAKATVSDGYLRDIGIYVAGAPHANDSLRHAIVWLRRAELFLV